MELFILFISILIILLYNPIPKQQDKIICSLHKWEYIKQIDNENIEYLQCTICGYLPNYEDKTQL